MRELNAQAAALRALHVPGNPVLLANAWDVASAKVVQQLDFPALATSSHAVAEAHGGQDDNSLDPDVAFASIREIADHVPLPITADIEAGYGLPADELVARLLAAGAVGCNIEDSDHQHGGLVDLGQQCARLAAIRAAATTVPIVINARVDVYIDCMVRGVEPTGAELEHAIERGRRYLEAGADCVFPFGIAGTESIGRYVKEVGGAVNVNPKRSQLTNAQLRDLGVARISLGGDAFTAAMAAVRELAEQLKG